MADKLHVTVSKFMRDFMDSGMENGDFKVVMPSEINQELLSEFNALANNFNQIAFNSNKFGVNPALAKLIVESLEVMKKQMKDVEQKITKQ